MPKEALMVKGKSEIIVDGYGSGEVNFLTRLDQDPAKKQEFIDNIIVPITNILAAAGTIGGILSIRGHSDRVDTPGLSHPVCLAQESDASQQRADSARAGTDVLLEQQLGSPPPDLDSLLFFFAGVRRSGAAVLVNDQLNLTEEQRKQNRRVQIRLVTFQP
jgi:hypothetical protein